jgi:hypothetical protein
VLPATIQLSSTLARLAMMLDKRPDLTRKLLKIADVDQEARKTLVEGTAESIQRAFTMCLTERTANRNGIGRDGKPEGKKVGIYSFANMVLRLLFQVWNISGLKCHDSDWNTVQEDAIGESDVHQHIPEFSPAWPVSCKPACDISLLSRTLPFREQPLLLCSTMLTISIRPVSRQMSQPAPKHTNLPDFCQHDSWQVSYPRVSRSTRSR